MVLVSVIIPVYNRSEELKRCIKSVLKQTIQDFEIKVVDDCSDVDLKAIIDDFNDSRIEYIRLDKKSNANVCRNVAINSANGIYIAMLDSDDEWLSNHLQSKIADIETQKADGVFGSCYIDDGESKKLMESRPIGENESMSTYLLTDGKAPTPTHVYKSNCAKSIKWDESLLRHQDFDFSIRFAEQYKFISTSDPTCIIHWKKNEKRLESIDSQIRFMKKHQRRIKPELYYKYFSELYSVILERNDMDRKIIESVKSESTRFIKYCSLVQFLSIEGVGRNSIGRVLLRFKYCLRVLLADMFQFN